MFKRLEGDTAMLRDRSGVYKPVELYEWDGGLYAKAGGGYVRIRSNGTTSKDGLFIEHMEFEGNLYQDRFGRLAVRDGEGYICLGPVEAVPLLLGKG